jgi:hypothetical protein
MGCYWFIRRKTMPPAAASAHNKSTATTAMMMPVREPESSEMADGDDCVIGGEGLNAGVAIGAA